MKHILPAIRIKLFFTLLLGLIYPLVMTGLSQVMFKHRANGSMIEVEGKILGSELIAQKFEKPQYFWPRPSGVDYNPLPSGGSNLGQASADLKKAVDERRTKLKKSHPDQGEPPQDLLFASASGLDPEISPEAALYQVSRVARARGLDVNKVQELVKKFSTGRQLGILGEPRVSILSLNIALDQSQGIKISPVYVPPPPPAVPPPPNDGK